jgi:hypothetical protein
MNKDEIEFSDSPFEPCPEPVEGSGESLLLAALQATKESKIRLAIGL